MQWLSLVREHLVKNLSMDEEDFDLTPLLAMRGGKGKARKVFPDGLQSLVQQLNHGIAA
jgi:type I restriction enzyme R subunit